MGRDEGVAEALDGRAPDFACTLLEFEQVLPSPPPASRPAPPAGAGGGGSTGLIGGVPTPRRMEVAGGRGSSGDQRHPL